MNTPLAPGADGDHEDGTNDMPTTPNDRTSTPRHVADLVGKMILEACALPALLTAGMLLIFVIDVMLGQHLPDSSIHTGFEVLLFFARYLVPYSLTLVAGIALKLFGTWGFLD